MLVVSSGSSCYSCSGAEWIQNWPHDGQFTVEEDRATVKALTKQLLELKCARTLQLGDVNRWRFYKALSAKRLGVVKREVEAILSGLAAFRQ